MSWLPKLLATYDACKGKEPEGSAPLMPICHSTQNAQIEIVLDGAGLFRRASVLEKVQGLTLIPCTEASGGRSGKKPVNHPLHDKLQYLAKDFTFWGGEVTVGFAKDPAEPYRDYLQSLLDWSAADPHPKLHAVLTYVQGGNVVADLIQAGILPVGDDGKLLKTWNADKTAAPAIFKVLAPQQSPDDAFVRWRVEVGDDANSAPWMDEVLVGSWISHYQRSQAKMGLCMATGLQTALAVQHPAKLRHGGDKAKLISANDSSGYTYRGRFTSDEEALGVGFVATQKAHNALRWLIERQGYRNGDQVFVAWEPTGKTIPDPMLATFAAFGGASQDWNLVVAMPMPVRLSACNYARRLQATPYSLRPGMRWWCLGSIRQHRAAWPSPSIVNSRVLNFWLVYKRGTGSFHGRRTTARSANSSVPLHQATLPKPRLAVARTKNCVQPPWSGCCLASSMVRRCPWICFGQQCAVWLIESEWKYGNGSAAWASPARCSKGFSTRGGI